MRKIVIPIIITSAIIPMIIIPIVEVPKLIISNKHDSDSIQQLYMQLAKFTTVIAQHLPVVMIYQGRIADFLEWI